MHSTIHVGLASCGRWIRFCFTSGNSDHANHACDVLTYLFFSVVASLCNSQHEATRRGKYVVGVVKRLGTCVKMQTFMSGVKVWVTITSRQ